MICNNRITNWENELFAVQIIRENNFKELIYFFIIKVLFNIIIKLYRFKMNKNKELFEQSEVFIPGGVNSPVRAFGSVGGTPIFFKAGMGSRLIDENDKEYSLDYL